MRVAFAGAGMVSELHRLAIERLPEIELVGVHDGDPDVAAARARVWDVRAYAGLDELLADDSVDAVHVLTTLDSHVEIAHACLEARRHVLVEKPVASDPAQLRALQELAARVGRVAMPGHNYAYVPEFRRMHRLVHEGSLGTIRSVFVTYAIAHSEEIARSSAGILESIMVHHSYLALALLGAPDRVSAGVAEPAWKELDREDQAWMVWEYAGGRSAHLFASFATDDQSADPWTFVVKVLGSEGSASLSFRSSIFDRAIGTLPMALPVYEESYEHELAAFVAACRDGVAPLSSMADAETAARVIASAYAAAREGRRVERGGAW